LYESDIKENSSVTESVKTNCRDWQLHQATQV
jgi:hypothetical protein